MTVKKDIQVTLLVHQRNSLQILNLSHLIVIFQEIYTIL